MENNTLATSTVPALSANKEVIERSLPLVKSVVARMRLAHGLRASFDDLYAAGVTGLLEAAERFDPTRGVAFTTFAYYRIRGAILDSQRTERGHSVARSSSFVQLFAVAEQRPANTNAVGSPERDGAGGGWAFTTSDPVQLVPFEVLDDMQDVSAPHPDEEIEQKWRSERVRRALATLPELERRVLELHYYDDESFSGISAQLGMCKPWAFRLHERALTMLRDALGECGDLGLDDPDTEDGDEEG
jgi:RNA polymerase sigma factor for flagellar operon FliA